MDWITIETSDLESVLNKPQLELLKAQSLKSAGRDPAFEILANIVAVIRAEIAASGLNALDPDHSRIPPELKDCALKLAVDSLQTRIPSMELSEAQKRHSEIARETLLRVSRGELPVSRPLVCIRNSTQKKGFYSSASKRSATKENLKLL